MSNTEYIPADNSCFFSKDGTGCCNRRAEGYYNGLCAPFYNTNSQRLLLTPTDSITGLDEESAKKLGDTIRSEVCEQYIHPAEPISLTTRVKRRLS